LLAYVVGVALGDGNLSNPNGRATRLRITCDAKYPRLARKIARSLLGWRVGHRSKIAQRVTVPSWISIAIT